MGGRGGHISEFEARLVYKVSSRTARAIPKNPVSKNKSKNKNKNKKTKKYTNQKPSSCHINFKQKILSWSGATILANLNSDQKDSP